MLLKVLALSLSLHPGISESDLLQKVLEYGVARRPKSWAYYVGQATNKIAGHSDLEEDLEKDTEVNENDTENIVLTDQSSESGDMMASKINKILFTANTRSAWNKDLWIHQFKLLINLKHLVGSGPATCVLNIITWPWRLLSALIPPPSLLCGTVSIIMTSGTIYAIISLVHDITVHLGCFLLLKDSIIGFVFISACLNLPHLVAAKVAAVEEETANLPLICLLTGKCLVISVGIGLPWRLVNLISYLKHGEDIRIPVDVRNLRKFILFVILGPLIVLILLLRRCFAGGELGGKTVFKVITTIIFWVFWLVLVIEMVTKFSILEEVFSRHEKS